MLAHFYASIMGKCKFRLVFTIGSHLLSTHVIYFYAIFLLCISVVMEFLMVLKRLKFESVKLA